MAPLVEISAWGRFKERYRKYPLPKEVVDNLKGGTSIQRKNVNGKLIPYYYPPSYIYWIGRYCLNKPTLYSAPAFRKNIELFFETFAFTYAASAIAVQTSTHHRLYNDIQLSVEKTKPRIFFHGRSNGFPTPRGVRAFQLAKLRYPQHEIWFGVDWDESSIPKRQFPFMDPQFRASAFLATGLIDHAVLLQPPISDGKNDYWRQIYAESGISPELVIIPDDDLTAIKITEADQNGIAVLKFSSLFGNEYLLFNGIHQTDLKLYTTDLKILVSAWEIVRALKNDS